MITRFSSPKNIIFLLVLTLLFFSLSCSENPSSPKIEEEKPLASTEIGSGGGTVKTEDVSITIPSGALGEKHNIAIYNISDDGSFGENTVSASFKINGLPNDYTKPIKIKMKYTGELGGQSFIAVGIKSSDIMSGDTSIAYNLFPASDSSGFLIGELPAFSSGSLVKTNNISEGIDFSPILKVLTKYTVKETEHFKIHYPSIIGGFISKVEDLFESSLNIINDDLGVSYYPRDVVKQTVIIKIQNKSVTLQEQPVTSKNVLLIVRRQMIFFLSLNDVINQKFSELNSLVGKYLMAIESTFVPSRPTNILWLDHAIASWSEELFTDDPNFKYPTNFPDNAMAPFNGMQAGVSNTSEKEHGYGMSSIIKYLTEYTDFGKTGIGKAYNLISKGADPVTALINNTDIPEEEWLPDFFKKYINGEIYNQSIDYFLSNVNFTWDINSASDTSNVFSSSNFIIKSYPDLSAKMFKINLNYEPEDTSSGMLLSMVASDDIYEQLSLLVYGIKGGKSEYLGVAKIQDFEIPNLNSYYNDGMKQFLIVLVNGNITSNDYLGESAIDLTVNVSSNNQGSGSNIVLDFNRCSFGLSFVAKIKETTSNGTSENDSQQDWGWYIYKASGSFSGNTFTGGFNERSGEYIGTITVTLNDDHTMITNFEYTFEYRPDEYTVANYLVSGNDLPSKLLDPSDFRFGISFDSSVCSHLSNAEYKYTDVSSTPITKELIDFSCDEYSAIAISFNKE